MRNGTVCRGVTLIELCFALAIVSILAGLAVPSLRNALRTGAVRSASLELLAGLQQARTTAIVEARPATLCLSESSGTCLPENAPAGAWHAFLRDGAQARSLALGALPAGVELRASRSRLDFWPDALAASTATLTICDRQHVARPRSIVVSRSGRVRLADAAPGSCDA